MKAINSILVVNRAFQDCHRPIRLGISLAKKFQSIMSLEKNQGFLEKEYKNKYLVTSITYYNIRSK